MAGMKTVTGRLVMRRVNRGSKSECDGFFIVTDDGKRVRVINPRDHYVDQPLLRALVGKRCEAVGFWFWDKLHVKSIKTVS